MRVISFCNCCYIGSLLWYMVLYNGVLLKVVLNSGYEDKIIWNLEMYKIF